MKKFQASLLFAVAMTGVILAGCQKPAVAPTTTTPTTSETATVEATMNVGQATKQEVEGSMTIVEPPKPVDGAITVTAEPSTVVPAGVADKAAEDAKATVTP